MVPLTATSLPAAGLSKLGEGPVWDDRIGRFLWVDIEAGEVKELDPVNETVRTWALGAPVGFAVPTNDPARWLAGRGTSVVSLDLTSGRHEELCRFSDDTTMRCNDGKADPAGRLWAGIMPAEWGAMTGSFFSVDHHGNVDAKLTGIGCSNGLAWRPDKAAFYYIDSLKFRIDRFRWDGGSGEIRFERTLARFDDKTHGLPDGMCIDAEGQLWVAFWNGACVRRIDAESGAEIARIDLPARQITSCAFGGEDLDTLYITSAWSGLDDEARARQPLAGSVFTVKPGVTGLPVDRFMAAE